MAVMHDRQAAMQTAMRTSAIPLALPCAYSYALSGNSMQECFCKSKTSHKTRRLQQTVHDCCRLQLAAIQRVGRGGLQMIKNTETVQALQFMHSAQYMYNMCPEKCLQQ